jgi:lipopolysaccharide biosynthesis glycosyltransferase
MLHDEVIRVYVGTDRSQLLAVSVLEHSIKRHTTAQVEVIPMIDMDYPIPKNPKNWQRTGFSFGRFNIPKLAGYKGKAIYMDADMQVFKDIRELWELPFNGNKVLIQQDLKHTDITMQKDNSPVKRIKQCSVMLLDCENLHWDVNSIVEELDEEKYSYQELMENLCILSEEEIGYTIPFEWNSLEYYDENTCLIHYTDMGTQPWVSTRNPNGSVWFQEIRDMLADGSLKLSDLKKEIDLGYFRPSLIRDIRYGKVVPKFLLGLFNRKNTALDKLKGYVPHKSVYQEKRKRINAVREYEKLNCPDAQEIG